MESSSSKLLRRDYRFTIIILTILSLSFNIGVLSFSDVKFRSRKVAVTKGYQNHHKRLYQSCLLDSNDNNGCGNVGDECSNSEGAAFVLSGSICGQNREYTLDNLDDNESGNEIKFCGPKSHQAILKWKTPPKRILLLSKPDPEILAALEKCLPYLVDAGLELYVEDSIYGQFQSLHDEREEGDSSVTVQEVISSNISDDSKVTSDISTIKIAVEKRVIELKVFDKESPRSQGVDLVIAFGGDGLLMHCNTLFGSGSIPPSMCFDFGSLGFLAPFDYKDFQEEVSRVLGGPVYLTLRMRLEATIYRDDVPKGSFHVLNEIVIDRGPSPFLAIIDLECDQQYLTTVQGDGIIVATPTGSTAYSLAAGGSMVHPSVPAILLTPICAHTLSFRPLLLPDSSVLMCSIPVDCRSSGWVGFDGKFRQELLRGDRLEVKLSNYPMPTINRRSFTGDWFDALRSGFMFNVRPRQKAT